MTQKKRKHTNPKPIETASLAFPTVIGTIFLVAALAWCIVNTHFYYTSLIAQGEVTSAQCAKMHTGRYQHLLCDYGITFRPLQSTKPSTLVVQRTSHSGYRMGEHVKLAYLANNPNSAVLLDSAIWFFPLGLFLVGLFFLAITLFDSHKYPQKKPKNNK